VVLLRGRSHGGSARIAAAVALSVALGSTAGAFRASAAARPAFFTLSPIGARALPGTSSATRYTVAVSHPPANNAPSYLWYVHLTAADPGCTDSVLPGGRRLSATEIVWANQGSSFVWYHGAKRTYRADRSYGCDQAKIGVGGYPGSVTIVAENEYQHCTASFAGTVSGPTPQDGLRPVCALGGYSLGPSTLPVPAQLVGVYGALSAGVRALLARAGRGDLDGAAVTAALAPLLRAQQASFGRLFPPIWGCRFETLFSEVTLAKAALERQIAGLASAKQPTSAGLRGDEAAVGALAASVRGCGGSVPSSAGAPRTVLAALDRLEAESAALRTRAGRGAAGSAYLNAGLAAFERHLDAVVKADFPPVFGMSFIELVDRTLAENAAVTRVELDAEAQNRAGTVAALRDVLGTSGSIGQELRVQAKRVVATENKKS
jgi:hypothetical protein